MTANRWKEALSEAGAWRPSIRTRSSLSRHEFEVIVERATHAPSILNIQPWQFTVRGGAIELTRDTVRLLPAVDPVGRALTISCGAALLNLRVAMAALGRRPQVELLPDGPTSAVLARVTAGAPGPPDRTVQRLSAALPHRRTSRVPFADRAVPRDVAVRLEDAAAAEASTFRLLDPFTAVDIGSLVRAANLAQRDDVELRAEVAGWVGRGAHAVDGVPRTAMGPRPRDPMSLVRDFAMGDEVDGRPDGSFEPKTTLGVLLTEDDGVLAWIEAGQALERVWLEATASGLSVSLLTQPLEVSILRWLARPLIAPAENRDPQGRWIGAATAAPLWPQVLLRLGVASESTPRTPRRPLADVLTFA